MLYPAVSNYWNSLHQSQAVASYAEIVANMDEAGYKRLWNEAQQYNQTLPAQVNRYLVSGRRWEQYMRLISVPGSDVMGYIEIPSVKVSLPIYHGVDEAMLQAGVGHIPGTSLPVGGPGTHCVLSGHRGLPSARLFTSLDRLEPGEIFMLRVLKETLTYEVDQTSIVLPDELQDIEIEPGRDHCTLQTCTPYGANTHRLLVRGHRVENRALADGMRVTADALQVDPIIVAPVLAAPILLVLLVLLLAGAPGKEPQARDVGNGR